jgi:hypothetical protein
MSLRVKLLIAAIALALSLFATFGDFFFVDVLGLTPGSPVSVNNPYQMPRS